MSASRTVPAALAAQQLVMAYDSTAMNVAISDIVDDLDTTLTGVQSAIALYALVMAAMMVTGSKLGTRHGHTRVFALGAMLYGAGALVTALSPGLPLMLVGWSLMEGLGAALVFPAILSIATLSFTGAERTKALSLIGAMAGAGAALGPILGGLITTTLTWRVSFLLEVLVTIGVLLLMRRAIEPRHAQPVQRFDRVGVLLSALAFGLIVLGLLQASAYGFVLWPTIVLVLAGAVVLAAFALWERARVRSGRDPLVRLEVLVNATTRTGTLAMGVQYLLLAGVMFAVPVLLQTALGYDALESGVAVLPATLMLLVSASVASRAVGKGRVSRKPLVIAGFVLAAFGALVMALSFEPDSKGIDFAPGLALFGAGLGLLVVLSDLVQSSAPADQVSDVAGLSRSVSYLGQSLGVALAGGVMVAALIGSFTTLTDESSVLSASEKTQIQERLESGVQVTAVSDDDLEAYLDEAGVAQTERDEVVRINGLAREEGLTATLLGMTLAGLLGALLALLLPPERPPPRTAGNGAGPAG